MMIEPTYKAPEITQDMDLECKVVSILLRVTTFLAVAGDTILSEDTILRIIGGKDKYAKLTMDAAGKFLLGELTPDTISVYIKRELQEML